MADYDFHQLSPDDFERLTRDLLQVEFGLRLESFKPGKDSGIDLRYAAGPDNLIVQCKHYMRTGLAGLIRELRNEALKVRKLSPSRYLIVTSVPLSPANKDTISDIFGQQVLRVADIFGSEDLNNLLGRYPQIEQKHFKLWLASKVVLDRVLHNAQITRSTLLVKKIYQDIKKYVPSGAYPRALDMLQKDNVVIIAGPPGVGKTTLANILLYEHVEKGFQAVVIQRDVQEGETLLHEGTKQIFYFDDFMGSVLLDDKSALSHGGDKALIAFMSAVQTSKTARFVLTTREHILSQALEKSERLRHAAISDFQIPLRMLDYSFVDKARILYNHLYFSDLPPEYQNELLRENFYLEIIGHEKFNPRLVEWLSSYRRIKAMRPAQYQGFVRRLLADPSEIWRHAYEQEIGDAARSILLTLFSFGGRTDAANLKVAFAALHTRRSDQYRYPTRPEDFRSALRELVGAFIKAATPRLIEILDPSILDLLNNVISESPENAIDIIQSALSFEQIQRVWAFARSKKGSSVPPILRSSSDEIAPTIFECMLAQRRFSLNKGSVVYMGVSLEKRLETVVQMAGMLCAPSILKLVNPMAEYMFGEWAAGECEIEAGVDLLRTLESKRNSNVPNVSELRKRTRDGLLEAAKGIVSSNELSELISVFDFDDPHDAEALPVLRESFQIYRSYFRTDLRDCRSVSDYEALAETLDLFRSQLGVEVADLNGVLESAKAEFEEAQAEFEDQNYDEWKERYYFERADNESVTNMFDTLKGDRE